MGFLEAFWPKKMYKFTQVVYDQVKNFEPILKLAVSTKN